MNSGNTITPPKTIDLKALRKTVFSRLLLAIPILSLVFFLPAGTLRYWQAWVYMGILIIPASLVMVYFLIKDPELLERRMRTREKNPGQKKVVLFGYPMFGIAFLLPGLDRRFGWSSVPTALVLIADALVLLGYGLFVLVLRENRYAARTVAVEKEQKVITSGPYAVVRHPMYSASIVLYGFSSLALGSYWAIIPFALLNIIYVVRILNEEKVLLQELEGYREYTQETRYRLIPGIW
jgi:protein-S-isoprenylcysteine O-methyltransferase Ste14